MNVIATFMAMRNQKSQVSLSQLLRWSQFSEECCVHGIMGGWGTWSHIIHHQRDSITISP
jgi:hypothetical protein